MPEPACHSQGVTAEQAVKNGRISVADRQAILERFSRRLQGYSYYEA